MKFKLNFFLSTACLLLLYGCGVVTSLPPSTYAELRLGDNGQRQLLIETDEWRGAITAEGYQGNKHWTQCWFDLQGDKTIYNLNEDAGHGYKRVGTITIETEHKQVVINLQFLPGDGSKASAFLYNGTYPLASVNHNPFYSDSNRK